MKKLNGIIKSNNVTVFSFPAFKGLEERSNKEGETAIISTLAPSLMLDKGIDSYYSPVIPRNTVFQNADDIIEADLDVTLTHVFRAEDITSNDNVIIVSRHAGTVDVLKSMYPNYVVLSSISPEDIRGKKVVGTLPPTLIQYAAAYKAATIKDFDYARDGDLNGEELKKRLIITDAIKVITE